jgi:hypothetical protein
VVGTPAELSARTLLVRVLEGTGLCLPGDPAPRDPHVDTNLHHELPPDPATDVNTASMVFETLFSTANPGIVVVVMVLAILAAGAVCWSLRLLLVDSRSESAADQLFESPGPALAEETGDGSILGG